MSAPVVQYPGVIMHATLQKELDRLQAAGLIRRWWVEGLNLRVEYRCDAV